MMFWIDRRISLRKPTPQSFFSGILLLFFMAGCHPSTLYYEPEPSPRALVGISGIYLDEVTGQNAELIRNLLIQELYKIPTFDVLETFPGSPREGVVLSAEVLVYSKRDQENSEEQQKTFLVLQDRRQPGKSTGQRLKNQVYDFVETPYRLKILNRTIDLSLKVKVLTPDQRVLYQETESIHFLQTYKGDEALVFMPQAEEQMERLARLLIQRLFDKLNPSNTKKQISMETGVSIPAWGGILSTFHSGLLKGNELAVRGDYEGAINLWNMVLFAPAGFERQKTYSFNDAFYETLKKKNVPLDLIQKLLELYGKTFYETAIEEELKQKISLLHYQKYIKIILQSSRNNKQLEQKNLAAAHYNLGTLHRLRNQLSLATYHFAQANAQAPSEKYAQAWTDVQQELGAFDNLNSLEKSIALASMEPAPPDVRVQPQGTRPVIEKAPVVEKHRFQPVELPQLGAPTTLKPVGKPSQDLMLDLE